MSIKDFLWQDRALCKDATYEGRNPFAFPHEATVRAEYEWCIDCPVAFECLRNSFDDPDGIWGGMHGRERLAFIRRHPTMGNVAMRDHQKILRKVRTKSQMYFAERQRRAESA